MSEMDLFNRDSMYWRDVNYSSPNAVAELELIEPMLIDGKERLVLICSLLPFEAHVVEYDLDNGGSFTKTEVKAWIYVLITNLDFYNDQVNPELERKAKLMSMPHSNVKSITLKDQNGKVVLKKAKVE